MAEMKLEAALESPALFIERELVPQIAQNFPELTPKEVADAFVAQYFHILRETPEEVHKFYKDASIMSRVGSEGLMLTANTVQEINEAILSATYKEWEPELLSVHAQDSIMGSVIVGVTGTLYDQYNTKRTFARTFFLAPQEIGGFYVHNDFMMLLDAAETETVSVPEAVPDSLTSLSLKESDVPSNEEKRISVFDPTPKEASEFLKNVGSPTSLKTKSEILVTKPVENALEEDAKKISYASILAKEVSLSTSAQIASPPVTVLPKAAYPAPSKASSAEAPTGIHIKDLAPDVTQEALLKEVQKFGIVKQRSIQIRQYPKDGYRYALVEFESPKSASRAVEGGELLIGGRKSEVQYKRSSNQGVSNHGRSERGGYPKNNFGGRGLEGGGGSNDYGPRESNLRNFSQEQGHGGSSGATKRNGGSTSHV